MEGKKKKPIGLILGLAFAALVLVIIIYVVINYTSDKNRTQERMAEVEELYQTFRDDVESFNEARDVVYQNVFQEAYYQTLKDNDESFKTYFATYLEALEKLDQDASNLEDKCINVLYPNVSVNNKCEAFVVGYEEATNTYISDVNLYNQYIEEYNQWLVDTSSTDTPLKAVELDRDYLDYDGDRTYRGKEDSMDSSVGENLNEEEEAAE